MADQKEMRRQVGRLETLQASWTEKAELALSKDREDLAKAALAEKQKAADMAGHLEGEIALLDNALSASDLDIAKLEARLREARARQSAIVARLQSAHHRARMREMTTGVRIDEAFRSEEHTSELQSLMRISYAVFCLKKTTRQTNTNTIQKE